MSDMSFETAMPKMLFNADCLDHARAISRYNRVWEVLYWGMNDPAQRLTLESVTKLVLLLKKVEDKEFQRPRFYTKCDNLIVTALMEVLTEGYLETSNRVLNKKTTAIAKYARKLSVKAGEWLEICENIDY